MASHVLSEVTSPGAAQALDAKTGTISVIIVSWNACGLLRECLLSIRAFGGTAIREIIVVDNASNDGSPEMVETEFPEVTLVRCSENLGFAKANNLGISRATGDFLALINSDVVVRRDTFRTLADALKRDPAAGLVGPKVTGTDGRVQSSCRRLPTVWTIGCRVLALDTMLPNSRRFSAWESHQARQDEPVGVDVLSGCFWMARREAVKAVGGLDERFFFYAEDVDWCKRFRDAGWRVLFVPKANVVHYGAGSSANQPLRYSIEILRANLAYWQKHHGTAGRLTYYLFSVLHHGLRFVIRGILKLVGLGRSGEARAKFQEDAVCLRWLLTGREIGAEVATS